MQVWVGSTLTAPRPSAWCVPRVPQMPEEAIESGITGRVEVTYEVDAQGVVGAIGMEGSPPPLLAGAVRGWLSGCLFEPAIQDGRRAASRVRQAFVFKIR
jgi:outer membrane biosynthesis protein TonB